MWARLSSMYVYIVIHMMERWNTCIVLCMGRAKILKKLGKSNPSVSRPKSALLMSVFLLSSLFSSSSFTSICAIRWDMTDRPYICVLGKCSRIWSIVG